MNCIFEEIDGLYICSRCGYKAKIAGASRNCSPSVGQKIVNFTKAVTEHIVSGREKSSQEEIDGRLAICSTCELFRDGICNHNSCGCNISNKKKFLNKLAWKDQKCPLNKW